MKKILLFAAALCGMTSFAATTEVATFSTLENGTKVGDYTVNGNCISGGTAWTYSDYITVIVKYSGLPSSGEQAIVTFHQAGNNDKAGVIANASKVHGLWEGNAWRSDGSSLDASGTIVIVYAPSNSTGMTVYGDDGTSLYAASDLKASSGSFGDAINFGAKHDGSMKLDGFKVEALQILKGAAAASEITTLVAAFEEVIKPAAPAIEPLMLLNIHNGTAVDGWLNHTQDGGPIIPNSGSLTTNGISFVTSSEGNFYKQRASGTSFKSGEFIGLDGKTYDSIASEVSSSLGLPTGVVFDDTVYNTGVMNGGKVNHMATLSGLDNSTKYLLYLGCGRDHADADYQSGFKFESSGCASVDELVYVNTDSTSYQTGSLDNDMLSTMDGLVIVRAKGIKPVNGTIQFKMVGGRSSLNFLAVAKVNESKPTSKTFEIAGEVSYDNLATEGLTSVTLNLTSDATVTFSEAVSAALTFTGSHNLTVKGAEHLTIANVADSGVTGNVTYEFGGAYTAADGLKNKIKAASTKYKFVFTGNATVDLGSWTGTLATHLVFRGGAHTFKHINGNSLFGKDATNENPTVMAENGATLNFYGHDLTGWSAAINQTGIVRAASGSTIVLHRNGNGTFYYNQMLVIDPGATIEVHSDLANNDFRMTGGTSKQMIYVMDQAADATTTPAKLIISSQLALAKDLDSGIGVYVGANAKLQITGTINSMNNAQNQAVDNTFARPIKKTGAGILEVSGNHGVTYEVAEGSIGGDATVQKVNLASGASLVLKDDKALKVQTALTLPKPINLVCEPVHGMTVITPPSAMEGYTATINGSEKTYELFMDGGALKLKYKTPPEFTEELGTITAIVADGKGGTVEVDISKLNLGDYSDSVSYSLKFGEVVVENPEVVEGKVSFSLNPETFKPNTVYRGEFIVDFGDGTISNEINVYQGERQFVMMDEAIVIKEKTTINGAEGCTITPVCNDPDYIDTCDSIYMVSISASEAVDANSDTALEGNEQGGVRIAQTTDGLELQVVDNGQWTKLADAKVDTQYTLTIKFHYNKGEGDEEGATSVAYTLDKTTKSATNKTDKLKVTEVFIADGTVLPADLTGLFQLDKAVVVDVEVEIGHGDTQEITAADQDAAQEIADKMVIAIASEIAEKLTNEQQEAYRGYFKVQVTQAGEGKFSAAVVFKADVEKAIEEDLEKAMDKVVSGFESGSAEIAAKPGLYYGVKRGDSLESMTVDQDSLTLATGSTVNVTITKPDTSKSHFYRIICSPTPATK